MPVPMQFVVESSQDGSNMGPGIASKDSQSVPAQLPLIAAELPPEPAALMPAVLVGAEPAVADEPELPADVLPVPALAVAVEPPSEDPAPPRPTPDGPLPPAPRPAVTPLLAAAVAALPEPGTDARIAAWPEAPAASAPAGSAADPAPLTTEPPAVESAAGLDPQPNVTRHVRAIASAASPPAGLPAEHFNQRTLASSMIKRVHCGTAPPEPAIPPCGAHAGQSGQNAGWAGRGCPASGWT